MTNKGILYLVVGALSAVGGLVALIAISNAENESKESVKKDLLKNSDEYSTAVKTQKCVKEDLERLNTFVTEENDTIAKEVADWKENTGYNASVRSIQVEAANKLNDFKESIGYDDEMKKLSDEFDKACEEVKERIGYEDKLASQKKLIADANKAYDTAVFFMEDNQASKAAKKAARKAKDKTIDTANEAIEELDKRLKKELKIPEKDFKEQKDALKKRLTDKKADLTREMSSQTDELNAKLNAARNKIVSDVKGNRSEEFKSLLEEEKSLVTMDKDLTKKLKGMYEDAYDSLTKTDMLVSYLKANNIKAPVVGRVGVMTGAPLFIVTYEYMAKLYYILKSI